MNTGASIDRSLYGRYGIGVENAVLLPPLSTTMNVSLMVNPEGRAWLVHDQPLNEILMWAEYDIDTASLTLVMGDGKIQNFGMPIEPEMRDVLRRGRHFYTMYMEDTKIVDCYSVPLLVRESSYYRAIKEV